MAEKHDRIKELRQLLVVTWETIGQVKPEAVSALLNTANRLSRDLYELENPGSTTAPAPVEDGATAVSIFQARMRKRDTRSAS